MLLNGTPRPDEPHRQKYKKNMVLKRYSAFSDEIGNGFFRATGNGNTTAAGKLEHAAKLAKVVIEPFKVGGGTCQKHNAISRIHQIGRAHV